MDTKENRPFSQEELEQIQKAMDEFAGICEAEPQQETITQQQETSGPHPEMPVNGDVKSMKGRKPKILWAIIAVIAVLALVFGYYNWWKLPANHPNSMVNRKQTITAAQDNCIGIYEDGTPFKDNYINIDPDRWFDLEAISMNDNQVVAIRKNGDVLFSGKFDYGGECVKWKNATAVSAGRWHTVGLLENGTVLAAGNNGYGQCDVGHWQDIVGISAGDYFTAGLRADGTVVLTQLVFPQDKPGNAIEKNLDTMQQSLESVSAWRNIIAISADSTYLIGLRADGTVVSAGYASMHQCDVKDWTNIVSISAGPYMSVGVRKNGTIVVSGMMLYYSNKDGERFPHKEVALRMLGKKIVAATSNGDSIFLLDSDGMLHHFYCNPDRLPFKNLVYEQIATGIRVP